MGCCSAPTSRLGLCSRSFLVIIYDDISQLPYSSAVEVVMHTLRWRCTSYKPLDVMHVENSIGEENQQMNQRRSLLPALLCVLINGLKSLYRQEIQLDIRKYLIVLLKFGTPATSSDRSRATLTHPGFIPSPFIYCSHYSHVALTKTWWYTQEEAGLPRLSG